jgi:hypothetical protein
MTNEEFYGTEIIDRMRAPLPVGYVSYRACLEYYQRESDSVHHIGVAGTPPNVGASWRHGPFRFEKYVSDVEPPQDRSGPLRMVIWQRLTRTDRPQGWMRGTAGMGFRMTGFSTIDAADPKRWTSHARRHLSHWKKLVAAGQREVVRVTVDEYLAAYKHADQDRLMKAAFPAIVRQKAKAHGERLHLICSRRPGGPLDAGFAYLHVPEAKTSLHLTAFMGGAGKEDSASTGLIDYWFQECARVGISILDFGFFWMSGDPDDWRGFSRFKSQFGIRLMCYPLPLFRFAGTWGGKAK